MTMTEKKHAIKPYPLGAHVEDGAIRFAYASGKKDCGILIYDRKSGKKTHRVPFRQEERMGNVYCKYLELEPENVGYQFYEGERTVPDLHAQGFLRKPAYGKIRKPADRIAVFPNEDFDWEQDMHPMLPYEDSTCYCLHVRGFTMHASSQVTHRGTFAGVVEKLDYLQEIGVTTVEFQPVYEFDETPEKTVPKTSGELAAVAGEKNGEGKLPGYRVLNYWGYREGFYYAPKAAYAAGEDPAEEFRLMVKEFHKRKMEVILQFYFPRGMDAAEIGNILRFWVLSYHVDGFHLMGEGVPAQMLAGDPALSGTKLWHYSFDTEQLYDPAVKPEYRNLAEYRDDYLYTMRRFLKGDDNMLSGVLYEMRHIPANMGRIHYLSNYYGFTLMDMVSYDHKHNEANGENNRDGSDNNHSVNFGHEGPCSDPIITQQRERAIMNMLGTLLLSLGTPMLLAGDEFGNSQNGNNNAYTQDNETTWLDWDWLYSTEQTAELKLFNLTSRLIALRKARDLYNHEDFFTRLSKIGLLKKSDRVHWFLPNGKTPHDADWTNPSVRSFAMQLLSPDEPSLLILVNGSDENVRFHLPNDIEWEMIWSSAEIAGEYPGQGTQIEKLAEFDEEAEDKPAGRFRNHLQRLNTMYWQMDENADSLNSADDGLSEDDPTLWTLPALSISAMKQISTD